MHSPRALMDEAAASAFPEVKRASCRRRRFRSAAGVLMLLVSCVSTGCTTMGDWVHNGFKVGPEYCKPVAPVADSWIDAYDERIRQELPDNPLWWGVFNDPVLNQLVDATYRENLPLRAAGMRVVQARHQREIAVGSLFPQSQQLTGSYNRDQVSKETAGNKNLGAAGVPILRTFDTWTTGLDVFWEVDVWGRFRRNIEAADASLEASVEDYDAILLSLVAETAATYAEYRTAQQQLAYAEENIKSQARTLEVVTRRREGGLTTEVDVTQLTAGLENTRELIPTFEAQVRNANLRLCTLTGTPPRDLDLELGDAPIPLAPPTVAVGIPANLIRRRPDVRAAERLVAAQSAQIGVATADLFPSFSITGFLGVQSQRIDDLFQSSSVAGFVAPGFNWNILNYGRLANNVRLQDARFQELAVDYQQTVLRANEEVEAAIVDLFKAQQRLEHRQLATEASKRSLELVRIQEAEGAQIDYNRMFILQQLLVQQQTGLAAIEGEIARSLIAVYKACGGGWEIRLGYEPAETLPADGRFEQLEPIAPATEPQEIADEPADPLPPSEETPKERDN